MADVAMRMPDLIAAKRRGARHSEEELAFIARGAASGTIPDYQLSAWLMAVCFVGMSEAETAALTRAMAASGASLSLNGAKAKVDKHSTGGVGDGVSLALAPLVAAAGLVVPMMSGRGLGHTGGTLDKLESIAGLEVSLPLESVRRQLAQVGVCLFGQTEQLAPADRKLYALRDATATVDSLPLIVASILSKKLAEGLDALVLDIKTGSGAIFSTEAEAEALGRALIRMARRLGLRAVGLMTAMDEPLGRAVGNALELKQAIEVLQGDRAAGDYLECLLALGGWMVHLGGKARSPEEGSRRLAGLIEDGSAAKKLRALIEAQGGDGRVVDDPGRLPRAPRCETVPSPASGFLLRLDARRVGEAAVLLGAGRAKVGDELDYTAGIALDKKIGDTVKKGEPVARLYGSEAGRVRAARERFLSALAVSARRPRPRPVVLKVLK